MLRYDEWRVAAGLEVQLARGIQNSVPHIWLADDSAPALGQQLAPHQRAAGPVASHAIGPFAKAAAATPLKAAVPPPKAV